MCSRMYFFRDLLRISNVSKIQFFHIIVIRAKCSQIARFSCLFTIGNLTICSGSGMIKIE